MVPSIRPGDRPGGSPQPVFHAICMHHATAEHPVPRRLAMRGPTEGSRSGIPSDRPQSGAPLGPPICSLILELSRRYSFHYHVIDAAATPSKESFSMDRLAMKWVDYMTIS